MAEYLLSRAHLKVNDVKEDFDRLHEECDIFCAIRFRVQPISPSKPSPPSIAGAFGEDLLRHWQSSEDALADELVSCESELSSFEPELDDALSSELSSVLSSAVEVVLSDSDELVPSPSALIRRRPKTCFAST